MKRTDFNKISNEFNKKKKINKADIFIYVLALVAFVLMIFVLIANRTQDLTAITYLFDEEDNNISSENIDDKNNEIDISKTLLNNKKNDEYNMINEIIKKDDTNTEYYDYNNIVKKEDGDKNNIYKDQISDLDNNIISIESHKIDNNKIEEETSKSKMNENMNDKNEQNKKTTNNLSTEFENISSNLSEKIEENKDKNKTEKYDNSIFENNKEENNIDKINNEHNIKNNTKNSNEKEKNDNYKVYKVKYGDAMWKIANKFSISNVKLIEFNKLENPDLIYPGQIIKIPNF